MFPPPYFLSFSDRHMYGEFTIGSLLKLWMVIVALIVLEIGEWIGDWGAGQGKKKYGTCDS